MKRSQHRPAALLCALLCTACAAHPRRPSPGGELEQWSAAETGLANGYDELWILPASGADVAPANPELVAVEGNGRVALASLDVDARVLGRVGRIRLRQTFAPFTTPPTGLHYRVALPADTTITDFVVRIGERRIRGVVRERDEAARMYAAARRQGLLATLVSRDASGAFRQRLGADVLAGGTDGLAIDLEYLQGVRFDGDTYTLPLPTTREEGVNTTARIAIESGAELADPHVMGFGAARIGRPSTTSAILTLRGGSGGTGEASVRWRAANEHPSAALFVHHDPLTRDTYFLLTTKAPAGTTIDWGVSAPDRVVVAGASVEARVVTGRVRGEPRGVRLIAADGTTVAEARVVETSDIAVRLTWAAATLAERFREMEERDDAREVERMGANARDFALDHGLVSFLTSFVLVHAR